MENASNLRELFNRFRHGHATPVEDMQLLELIRTGEQAEYIHTLIAESLVATDCHEIIRDVNEDRVINAVYNEIHRLNSSDITQHKTIAEVPPRQQLFRWWKWFAAAAVIFVAGCWGVIEYIDRPKLVMLSVPYSKTYTIILPDSSSVSLNGGSTISYRDPFDGELRRVMLTKGQAFFDVKRNPEYPFVVETQDLDVTVIGTSFEVRSYTDERESRVSVVSGQVNVTTHYPTRDTTDVLILKPLQQLIYDREQRNAKLYTVTEEFIAPWRSNELRYQEERLDVVLRDVARKYNTPIKITNPRLAEKRITGVLGNASLKQALEVIVSISSINHHYEQDTLVIH